jgi:uncharacterized membrane protein
LEILGLLAVAYVVAFIYTLVSSIRSASRINTLEREIKALKRMLAAGQPSVATPQAVQTEAAPQETFSGAETPENDHPTPDFGPQEHETSRPADPVAQDVAVDQETVTETVPEQQVAAAALPPRESFENRLGARWAVWAGGIALAFGGIFLVKYSIESGLLSPAVRLAMAGIFGLLLWAAGEAIRRKAMPNVTTAYSNAMIPGVLTAAGSLTLFGVFFAAYGIYDYIGPTTTFIALGLVAFATLGLSLLHGQALAGLGLLGSMLTPALISTQTPNIWALFIFLTISWAATAIACRSQNWKIVPALANAGLGLWALGYIGASDVIDLPPPTLALLAMIAGTIFIWPAKAFDDLPEAAAAAATPATEAEKAAQARLSVRMLKLLARHPIAISLTVSMAAVLPALAMVLATGSSNVHPGFAMASVITALAALGASRHFAVWPAVFSALGALAITTLTARGIFYFSGMITGTDIALPAVAQGYGTDIAIALGLGVVFLICGFAFLKRKGAQDADFALLWAGIAAIIPVWLGTISFVEYGNLSRDWLHAAYGVAVGLALLAGAEWLHKQDKDGAYRIPLNLLVVGSFAAFTLTLHTLTDGLATTVLLSVLGFAYVVATRQRTWDALPWVMAIASVGVLGRIGWEPTIVGPQNLGTTPVFNALLPGYGIPAVLAIASAYLLRNWPEHRAKNFLQAIASLMGLLAIAILVRHAMNGGVLADTVPTLGEQSIYTLLTIGMSGVLMTLDLKSPSPVFRYGSMIAGVIAMANVLTMHFGALNPYFSGENTGPWPFLNLLLIGYLLPGLAYGGLAYYARDKRPLPYVVMLALSGAALLFAWATLSVRRFWQGENIADWKGFLQSETYTYSVVWLAIGVLLLVLGSKFDAKSLRLASAALVLLAVAKAFLIDMSNLEGVLRALSFIGLGVVLIGIGLFYQKILTGKSAGTILGDSKT